MVSLIAGIALTASLLGTPAEPAIIDAAGSPAVYSDTVGGSNHQVYIRNAEFNNGDRYEARKVVFSTGSQTDYIWNIALPGTSGTVRYHDPQSGWKTVPLSGSLPYALLHIDTDKGHMILNPAHVYKRFGTSLEEQTALIRPVTVAYENGIFTLSLRFPGDVELEGHSWYLMSDSTLIDWNAGQEIMWSTYGRLADQRWSYDGYFYKTPDSYTPYSPQMYWRNPGAYLPRAVTISGQSKASDRLSWVMLDTMLTYQDSRGFWISDNASSWLSSDYGIGAGFYDTRFNADTTETYITGYTKTHDRRFLEAAKKQLDFYQSYAKQNHYEVKSGSRIGWLVYDYSYPGYEARPALCALNHQLQEIYSLLYAFEITGYREYFDLSEKLMEGIRITRDRWIKSDGSLEYAYMPDGTMGKVDYPYLTYNNLFDLQKLRLRLGFAADPDLQVLMDSKKAQMDKDGIVEYKK